MSREYKTSEAKRAYNKAYSRVYYEANKENLKAKRKAFREANKEKERARLKACYTSNIPFRLLQVVKGGVYRVAGKKVKKQEAMDLLGCTFEEYQEYLESKFQPGMTWENHAREGWHIDHILPLKESEVSEEEKLKRLHYKNTQPLWAEDNISKGNKLPSV